MKLIYTGYNWRPMKRDELEIMCESRILEVIPDEPEAGDIVEVEEV